MFHRPNTTICREGWYYLLITVIVFAGAMAKEVNLLLVLAGMMLGLMLFHWQALFVSLKGLTLQRKMPQAVCAGDLLAVSLRLNNTRPRFASWAIAVDEHIQRESNSLKSNHNHNHRNSKNNHDKPITTSVFYSYVPAGEERIAAYHGRLVKRGRYRLGPMRIHTRFPFGLFSRKITLDQFDTLYVYPRLGRLTRSWLARHRKALAGSDRRQRKPGPEGDFYGVREWRSGDSLRFMHWRSSARTGKLVVRQFEQAHNRDVAILMDLWAPDQPSDAQLENVENAISFTATVLNDLCRQGGGKAHLCVFDTQPQSVGGPASTALLQDIMKSLAVIEAQCDDRLPALIEHLSGKIALGTEIIIVSTRPIDLSDNRRFAVIGSDAIRNTAHQNIRCIDASSDELAQYFIVE
jgi:uncharacterized protein (DUF58 family)